MNNQAIFLLILLTLSVCRSMPGVMPPFPGDMSSRHNPMLHRAKLPFTYETARRYAQSIYKAWDDFLADELTYDEAFGNAMAGNFRAVYRTTDGDMVLTLEEHVFFDRYIRDYSSSAAQAPQFEWFEQLSYGGAVIATSDPVVYSVAMPGDDNFNFDLPLRLEFYFNANGEWEEFVLASDCSDREMESFVAGVRKIVSFMDSDSGDSDEHGSRHNQRSQASHAWIGSHVGAGDSTSASFAAQILRWWIREHAPIVYFVLACGAVSIAVASAFLGSIVMNLCKSNYK